MDPPSRPGRRFEERLARRGGAAELLRPASALYSGLVAARNALHDRGWLPAARLDLPVVCVGNLSVGGTGKTPFVVLLARELQRRGRRPGLLSRGYGRRAGGRSDEGLLFQRALPGVPHVEDPDRVRGGRALEARGVDVVVLDDGFQHRRLARELDLVLVDATRPWGLPAPPGGGPPVCAVLPRGLLREPPQGLARAGAIVLTRCDQAAPEALEELEAELLRYAPGAPVLRARHRPSALVGPDGAEPPEALAGREVALVSGLGNPEAFERTARALGAVVRAVHRFPDHHAFSAAELEPLRAPGVELLVSEKDAVKLEPLGLPLLVLEVALELLRGGEVLEALLDALPRGRAGEERAALHAGLAG